MIASGTELELALNVQERLKENNIHSKGRLNALHGTF